MSQKIKGERDKDSTINQSSKYSENCEVRSWIQMVYYRTHELGSLFCYHKIWHSLIEHHKINSIITK